MRLAAPTPDDGPDAGFTLIELLIAVAILGVISLALGGTVIGFLRNTDATSERLALSHDAQISAAYFARDVASVGRRDYTSAPGASGMPFLPSIQLDAAYNAGGLTCGTSATPTALVRFLSDDWDNSGATAVARTDIVAYYLKPAGAISELHRITCIGPATEGTDVILAHHVDPATLTLTCSSTCDSTMVPQQASLSFSVTTPSVDAYQIILTGQRRQT